MTTTVSTAGHTGTSGLPWREYIRRGGLAFVLAVLLGLIGGLLVAKLSPKRYTATAAVLVSATGVESGTTATNGRTSGDINLDTEAQLVTSAGVLAAATAADQGLDRYSTDHLLASISVTVPANTTVLQISYTDTTPRRAQVGANALATAYLDNRETVANNLLGNEKKDVNASISALNQTLKDDLSSENKAPAGSPQRSYLDLHIGLTKSRILAEQQNLVELNSIQITPGRVVSPAILPTSPSSPSLILDLASGFAVGLILGLFAAWALTRYRRTVRTPEDLSHVVDAPCVAVVRNTDPAAVGAVGTYRHLTLVTAAVVHPPARLVVTSPFVSSTCSHVAAGIAASLTRAGTATALLQVHGDEIDSPHPPAVEVHRVLDADDLVGPEDRTLDAALDHIRGENGILVIDTPGAIVTADAQIMAAESDAVLVIVTAGTRSAIVRETVAGLDRVGAPILGTVLVPDTTIEAPSAPPARGARVGQFNGRSTRDRSGRPDAADQQVTPHARAGATPRG